MPDIRGRHDRSSYDCIIGTDGGGPGRHPGERFAGAGDAIRDEGPGGRRSWRGGVNSGHRRHPRRHRCVTAWWQRRRRRGCGGGHARGDRAVLLRYRRWRLLRVLRRPYQDGAHHRRPGGRASDHAGERVRRPRHRAAVEFQEARVSGISVGVPGTPRTWQTALRKWGTISLRDALRPAIKVADRGFVVDQTFQQQINENLAAFSQFSSSSALYLPDGAPPAVGSTFRNPDLARTYRLLSRRGIGAFYRGELAADIVRTVQHPPLVAAPPVPWPFPIRPGKLEASDLADYAIRTPAADPHALPRLRRVRDANPVQRRIDSWRRAQHRRELGSRRAVADPGAAPVPRSERARFRRPQPLRRRQHPARIAR